MIEPSDLENSTPAGRGLKTATTEANAGRVTGKNKENSPKIF